MPNAQKAYLMRRKDWIIVGILSANYCVLGFTRMRKLQLPQKLIVPVTVMLRYFPAIREETGHICDAMKLRGVRGFFPRRQFV